MTEQKQPPPPGPHEGAAADPTGAADPTRATQATQATEAAEATRRVAELEDAWRRTAAELENSRKRCVRDVARARAQERAAVAGLWLPVLDNLERALEHAASHPDQVVEGVRAVHLQALAVLAGLGYPRRDDEGGRAFDPAHHEAVSTVVDESLVPGTVAHVVRSGYGPDDAILRPASVVVATRGP